MERFRKILVYANTDRRHNHALDRAGVLARRTGAVLKVVDIVAAPPNLPPSYTTGGEPLQEAVVKEKRQRLQQVVAPLRAARIHVETEVLAGSAFVEIVKEVMRNGHDLVFKTATPDGSTRQFGSTAGHLIRKCPCPVWIVKPMADFHGPRVLAAIDPLSSAVGAYELNSNIVDLARAVAASEGGELHLVHVWRAPYEETLSQSGSIGKADLDEYVRSTKEEVRTAFNDFVSQLGFKLTGRRKHILRGDPGTVIPRFAANKRFDLLVMGTTAQTADAGVLIGDTAERILGQAQCSVLVVKPDSFRSVVRL
jgi:nucleotide-binding universal stress UspA family protein